MFSGLRNERSGLTVSAGAEGFGAMEDSLPGEETLSLRDRLKTPKFKKLVMVTETAWTMAKGTLMVTNPTIGIAVAGLDMVRSFAFKSFGHERGWKGAVKEEIDNLTSLISVLTKKEDRLAKVSGIAIGLLAVGASSALADIQLPKVLAEDMAKNASFAAIKRLASVLLAPAWMKWSSGLLGNMSGIFNLDNPEENRRKLDFAAKALRTASTVTSVAAIGSLIYGTTGLNSAAANMFSGASDALEKMGNGLTEGLGDSAEGIRNEGLAAWLRGLFPDDHAQVEPPVIQADNWTVGDQPTSEQVVAALGRKTFATEDVKGGTVTRIDLNGDGTADGVVRTYDGMAPITWFRTGEMYNGSELWASGSNGDLVGVDLNNDGFVETWYNSAEVRADMLPRGADVEVRPKWLDFNKDFVPDLVLEDGNYYYFTQDGASRGVQVDWQWNEGAKNWVYAITDKVSGEVYVNTMTSEPTTPTATPTPESATPTPTPTQTETPQPATPEPATPQPVAEWHVGQEPSDADLTLAFKEGRVNTIATTVGQIEKVDLNGDGYTDAAIVVKTGEQPVVWYRTGAGFGSSELWQSQSNGAICGADHNNDGLPDTFYWREEMVKAWGAGGANVAMPVPASLDLNGDVRADLVKSIDGPYNYFDEGGKATVVNVEWKWNEVSGNWEYGISDASTGVVLKSTLTSPVEQPVSEPVVEQPVAQEPASEWQPGLVPTDAQIDEAIKSGNVRLNYLGGFRPGFANEINLDGEEGTDAIVVARVNETSEKVVGGGAVSSDADTMVWYRTGESQNGLELWQSDQRKDLVGVDHNSDHLLDAWYDKNEVADMSVRAEAAMPEPRQLDMNGDMTSDIVRTDTGYVYTHNLANTDTILDDNVNVEWQWNKDEGSWEYKVTDQATGDVVVDTLTTTTGDQEVVVTPEPTEEASETQNQEVVVNTKDGEGRPMYYIRNNGEAVELAYGADGGPVGMVQELLANANKDLTGNQIGKFGFDWGVRANDLAMNFSGESQVYAYANDTMESFLARYGVPETQINDFVGKLNAAVVAVK